MLKGKTVVLGVCGSIAAYKIANLASMLVKLNADVHVIMTQNATNFINPITFETLTNNKCIVDTFDRNFEFSVMHVSLAKAADVFMVAPASANVLGKVASGIADDMLTTTLMASRAPIIFAPAMNTGMYENKIVQDNIHKLKSFSYEVIEPDSGFLACKDIGKGKMPDPEILLEYIIQTIAYEKDLKGKKILVSAGATKEAIDPVRYITNHSSGKMGYAIACAAARRGANVTLISAKANLKTPLFLKKIDVVSAADMKECIQNEFDSCDALIMAAAVADYKPKDVADHKIKKSEDDLSIKLCRTDDILATIATQKKSQFVCGFSMETENLVENSKKKLVKKNLDMIAANNLNQEGAGFEVDTNVITLITKDDITRLPIMSKEEVAHKILDRIKENI